MKYKASIIIPYFGKLPDFTGYFLTGCAFNPKFRWIIFSDQETHPDYPENVHFKHFTITQFEELAYGKLGFRIIITDPYKLCDFKPAFGLIFQDYIKEDTFWGYGDLDMVFGRIDHFIPDDYFDVYDIMSFYPGFMSGPFCLFRNTEYIRNLFKSCKAYKRILQDPKHFAFDENIYQPALRGISISKLFELLVFAFKKPQLLTAIKEFRYQYQWHFKRRFAGKQSSFDMTDAVFNAHRNGLIKSVFFNFLLTDPYFERIKMKNWTIRWNKGILIFENRNKEIMAFHFQDNKSKAEFQCMPIPHKQNGFTISPTGFSS